MQGLPIKNSWEDYTKKLPSNAAQSVEFQIFKMQQFLGIGSKDKKKQRPIAQFLSDAQRLISEIFQLSYVVLHVEATLRRKFTRLAGDVFIYIQAQLVKLPYEERRSKTSSIVSQLEKLRSFLVLLGFYNDDSFGKAKAQLELNFQPKIDEQETRLKQLKVHVQNLTKIQQETLKNLNVDVLNDELKKKKTEITSLEAEISNFKVLTEKQQNKLLQRKKQLEGATTENKNQRKVVERLQLEIAEKKSVLEDLVKQLTEKDATYKTEIRLQKETFDRYKTQVAQEQKTLKDSMKAQLKKKQQQKQAFMEETRRGFAKTLTELQTQNKAVVQNLKDQLKNQAAKNQGYESNIKKIKDQYETKIRNNDQSTTMLKKKGEESQKSINDLKLKLQQKQKLQQALQNKIQSLNNQFNQKRAKDTQQYSQLIRQKAGYVATIGQQQTTIKQQKKTNADLNRTVSQLRSKIDSLKQELITLQQKHTKELQKLNNDHDQSKRDKQLVHDKAIHKLKVDLQMKDIANRQLKDNISSIKRLYESQQKKSIDQTNQAILQKNRTLQQLMETKNRNDMLKSQNAQLNRLNQQKKSQIKKMKKLREQMLQQIQQQKGKSQVYEKKYILQGNRVQLIKNRVSSSRKQLQIIRRAFHLLSQNYSSNTSIMASFLTGLLGAVTKNQHAADIIHATTQVALNNLANTLGTIQAQPEPTENVGSSDLANLYDNSQQFYTNMELLVTQEQHRVEQLLQSIHKQTNALIQLQQNNSPTTTVAQEQVVNHLILNSEAIQKSIKATAMDLEDNIKNVVLHSQAQDRIEDIAQSPIDYSIFQHTQPQRDSNEWNFINWTQPVETVTNLSQSAANLYLKYR